MIILLTIAIFAFLLIGTSSLFSGYHLVDDHDTIRTSEWLREDTFFHVVLRNIQHWPYRFRPFYTLMMTVKAAVFGDDMFAWMMVSFIEGCASFLFLYFSARVLHYRKAESLLFSGIIHFGAQFTPWYRAINAENIGMCLLSFAFFLITYGYYYHTEKKVYHRRIYRITVMLAVILSSGNKEAFVIAIPSILCMILYCSARKEFGGFSFKVITSNLDYMIVLLLTFLVEMYIIIFICGVNMGYAGFDGSTTLQGYLDGVTESFAGDLKIYVYLTNIAVICVLICARSLDVKRWIKRDFLLLLSLFFGMLLQLALHAKSRMWQRYLLPFILFWAISFLLGTFWVIKKEGFMKLFFTSVCCLVLCIGVKDSWYYARSWALQGENVRSVTNDIAAAMDEGDPNIFLNIMGGQEWDYGLSTWIRHYYPDGDYLLAVAGEELPENISYDIIVTNYQSYFDTDDMLHSLGAAREDYEASVYGEDGGGYESTLVVARKAGR